MKKSKLIFLLPLLFFVLKKQGQERIIFNYENYIENIIKNNPVSLVGENTGTYGRLKYKAARGNYDPMISGTIQQKQLNNVHYYTAVQGEVKQPLFTSQYLKLGYEYGQGSFINPEHYTSSSYGLPYVGIEVGLLQGMLFDKRRAEVLNARHQVNYYEAERKILINELLYESSIAYFDWLFSKRQYNLFNYFYSLAQQRFDAAVELAKYGERPAIDTLEADILLQSRLLDMRTAEIENTKQFAQINSYNWNSATEASRLNKELLITDSLEAYFDRVKEKIIAQYAADVQTNPLIQQYQAKKNMLEVDQKLKRELIKPKLDVNYNFLSYNTGSLNPDFRSNNYKWGASLSFPLLLRTSRNEYKMASLNTQNTSLELGNKSNELRIKQDLLKQNIRILSEQLQNADKTARYSKQLLEAEKLKFANGESSLFMINTRENKWLESELKLAEYKLKFIKTLLNMIYLNGNLDYKL